MLPRGDQYADAVAALTTLGYTAAQARDAVRKASVSDGDLSLEELVGCAVEVAGDGHHFRAIQLPLNLAMPEAAARPTQPGARGTVPLLAAAAERGMTVMASASLLQSRVIGRLPATLREVLGGPHGGSNVCMADGSVHFLKDPFDLRVLGRLATRAGGETVNGSDWQ